MVTDQEPRYRLVDADGNVVGSLFAETDGTLKLQEGTSGNDNELSLSAQGGLEVQQAIIGETSVTSQKLTIPDDDVTTVTGTEGSVVHVMGSSSTEGHATFIQVFNDINIGSSIDASFQGNTTLNGTTGTDGELNIAIDGFTIYLENRSGIDPANYTVTFIGL